MYISHLAENTQRQKLLDLDALYNQTDKNFGFGALDKALRYVDVDTLTSILDSFFNHLNNKSRKSITAEIRFKTAVQFVKDISNRVSRSLDSETYKKIERQLNKTFSEYHRLHLHKSKQSEVIRALGTSTDLVHQKLRAFFGWSIESNMPRLYARSSIYECLEEKWSKPFEQVFQQLRSL